MEFDRSQYRNPWESGFVAGIFAYAVGLGLTHHFLSFGQPVSFPVEMQISSWKYTVWYFYDAQFVGLTQHASAFGNSVQGRELHIIRQAGGGRFTFLYLLPAIGVLAGATVVCIRAPTPQTPSFAMLNGAHVAVGYLPCVILGAVTSGVTRGALGITATLQPNLVTAFGVVGLAYPIAGGAVGGLLYYAARWW